MTTIYLPCADGSDRQCEGMIPAEEYSANYRGLTDEQKQEIQELANNHPNTGFDFEAEINGTLIKIMPAVCGACGSDYTRDDEGNILD